MSTAVLISGQMRTFAQCYPTQRWQIFRHYEPDIHFFVSCVDDTQAQSAELLRQHYQNVHIEKYTDPTDLPEIPIEKGAHAPYANATTHKNLMLQHWGNKKVWEFFQSQRGETNFTTIIRIRPDQFIHRFIKPQRNPYFREIVHSPWWGKFGGINDRLGIMHDAAHAYFTLYDHIPALLEKGCPFHPETLLARILEFHNFPVCPLMAECSTQRMDGTRRWPEISASDLAELTYELSLK